jgi:hypothetical protein
LRSGTTPSTSRAGATSPSGPALVLANLGARPARGSASRTPATSGPSGSASSGSDALSMSVANRLQARLATSGSTLYRLTWKRAAMKSGRSYCLLRAVGLRISGTAATGWPSPTAKDCDSSGTSASNQGNTLTDAARMAGWATPQTHDAIGPKTTEQIEAMRLRGREKGHEPGVSNLNEQALLAGWATPSTGDWRTPPHSTRSERDGSPAGERLEAQAAHVIPGASLNGLPARTESRGLLNPRFSAWLQGIPPQWDMCAPPPTPRGRRAG